MGPARHHLAITSGAPGTNRATLPIAAINWVTVSWVATASSKIVESIARRVFPASTPVCATTAFTASRSGSVAPIAATGPATPSTSSEETPPR